MALSKPDEPPDEKAQQPSIMREGKNSLCPIRASVPDHPEPWYKVIIPAVSSQKHNGINPILSQALHPYVGTPGTHSGSRIETDIFSEWKIQIQNILYSFHACIYGPLIGGVR